MINITRDTIINIIKTSLLYLIIVLGFKNDCEPHFLLWATLYFLVYTTSIIVPIRVEGCSMFPTLHPGDTGIAIKMLPFMELNDGDIYVFQKPNSGEKVIKRLRDVLNIDGGELCYFLGDNPPESFDSRSYGWVKRDRVLYKVIYVKGRKLK